MTRFKKYNPDFMGDIDNIAPTPILIAPQPVLRQLARPVTEDDMSALHAALPGMFAAMYKAPGIGLAAPQVGISQRFILIDVSEKDEERHPILLINPEIIDGSETLSAREEGCLSLPNQYAEVVRPKEIRVRYRNIEGELVEQEADDLLATCIQHEIDHLDGVLFIDHLSALKRNMILRRLSKEQKRKR